LRSAIGNVFSHASYENIWPGRYNEEDAANMRLIAAAPDLYLALGRLLYGPAHPDWAVHVHAAREAMSKAEGR
jgi:hypothetical protein